MRIRFTYNKNRALRYTSTLDIQLMWERACRRASLPIAYSQGYHPQARIQQALPLPLGFTSTCEIVDIWFETELPVEKLSTNLDSIKTLGIEITKTEIIIENAPSLQKTIDSCEYAISPLLNMPKEIFSRITEFLSQRSLVRIRNEKSYDLRPLVLSLILIDKPDPFISARLSASGGSTARPEEVIAALGSDPNNFEYLRTSIFMNN